MSHDSYTEILVVGHFEDGLSFVNTSSMTLSDVITEQDGLDSVSLMTLLQDMESHHRNS